MSNDNPLPHSAHGKKVIEPLPGQTGRDTSNPAVELIRQKIDTLYEKEPNAKEELAEAEHTKPQARSKHQKYMHELSASGKSLAEIQTAWHQYYVGLPDKEKHEVWHEFYAEHSKVDAEIKTQGKQPQSKPPAHKTPHTPKKARANEQTDIRSVSDVKNQLARKVNARSRATKNPHVQSLLFGLGMGAIVVMLLLFGFFNERIIAPFITPSRAVSNTPIIIDAHATNVGKDPKIIIPKINVEIPVVYDEPSIQEEAVQKALERGVLHYATTPNPGEIGNAAIFGHSSNNILNRGQYKFAFVLLNRLENGDTFMLHKDGKRYVYKVFDKKIVNPRDLSVLDQPTDKSLVSLITCDPPGTTINRLVVVAEQISPDPASNVASSVNQTASAAPATLPSNSPSLWSRLTGWL